MKQNISEDDFRVIFSHEKLRKILLIEVESYPLIYYFKNYFIDRIMLSKNQDNDTLNSGSKLNNINKLAKKVAFYIKSSLTKNKATKDDVDVLFISLDRFVDIKTQDGEIYNSDYLFSQVIRELNSRHPDYKIALVVPAFRYLPNLDYVHLYNLFQYSTPLTLIKSVLFSLRTYLRWRFNRIEIANYLKDNDFEDIIHLFDDFFVLNRLFYFNMFDRSLKNVLYKFKPRIIISNNDVLNLKPNVDFGDAKFIVMQPALYNPDIEAYKKMFHTTFSLEKVVVDYFLAIGTKFKGIKKNVNDSDKVIVTGLPKYDILANANKIYGKAKILKSFGLNPNMKTILWCTSTHSLPFDENELNINIVYNAIKSLENVQLIIKLHPAENQEAMLFKKNKSLKPVIIGGKSDTLALIYACDLLVAKSSTTIGEAVALNKPVIVLNLSGEPDITNYVESGVAMGVYDKNTLDITIEKLLKDDVLLEINRNKFVYEHFYNIDGHATNRIVNLIEKLI